MPVEVDRTTAEDFYRACAAGDRPRILAFFADDAVWTYCGPPDVLPFCGQHRGKEAIAEVYRRMHEFISLIALETPFLVVEGDTTAAMICIRGQLLKSNRIVTARGAHFLRWHAKRIASFHAVLDSLDHVEQVLGHELVTSAA